MKFKQNIYILVLIICIPEIFKCIQEEPNEYEILEYLGEKKYTLNKTKGNEKVIYLQMEVDKILTKSCLIDIHQTDPQKVKLEYKFEKGEESSEFISLKNWITINNRNEHTLCYEMKKPKEKGYTLYMKITVSNFKDKQEFSVESTKSQFNFYLLVELIIGFSALLVLLIVFLTFYCMFKSGGNKNDLNDFDVVFAKVGPEDF